MPQPRTIRHAPLPSLTALLAVVLLAAGLTAREPGDAPPKTPSPASERSESESESDKGAKDEESVDPGFQLLVESMTAHIRKVDPLGYEAPEFPAGKEWFNSSPLSFKKELRGKITVLDFWTYCCINCIHVLPDLAYLREKYAGYPVAFVGVHSAKFENEKVSENIRQAVLRYEIEHPVINDDEMLIWRAIGVRSWPSFVVVGPRGNLLLMASGEGQRELLDAVIGAALKFYPPETFRHEPLPIRLERLERLERDARRHESPLRYPGKLAIDPGGKRLFISDSNHHRIVVTDLEGRFLAAIGSGRIGFDDGPFETATFNRLQGLAYHEGKLYVADAENHALRRVDLEERRVVTLVGDGKQGRDYFGGHTGKEQQLSTPWDVVVHQGKVYIAMAGTHQIWVYDVERDRCMNFSGTGRERNLNSDDALEAAWAQPSGLTVGAGELFIADSESSAIRSIQLEKGATRTIVGGDSRRPENLFAFGDRDGKGDEAQLQHPLGVLWLESKKRVAVADTYNHRLKLVDPEAGSVVSWVGSGKSGLEDGTGDEARFSEPSGFALGADGRTLYVADTNNHAIRRVDVESGEVTTLALRDVPAPRSPVAPRTRRLADLAGTPRVRVGELRMAPGSEGELVLRLRLPPDHKYLEGGESRWQVVARPGLPIAVKEEHAAGTLGVGKGAAGDIVIPFRALPRDTKGEVLVEALAYFCKEKGACRVSGVLFRVPVTVVAGAQGKQAVLEHTLGDLSGKFELLLPGGK